MLRPNPDSEFMPVDEDGDLFLPGEIRTGWDIAEMAVKAHYDVWDIDEAEETDLPERIAYYDTYTLQKVSKDARPSWSSIYTFDESKAEELAADIKQAGSYKPIVFSGGLFDIEDGNHRAWAVIEILEQPYIWGWVPELYDD
jgi:hypothetical protein